MNLVTLPHKSTENTGIFSGIFHCLYSYTLKHKFREINMIQITTFLFFWHVLNKTFKTTKRYTPILNFFFLICFSFEKEKTYSSDKKQTKVFFLCQLCLRTGPTQRPYFYLSVPWWKIKISICSLIWHHFSTLVMKSMQMKFTDT